MEYAPGGDLHEYLEQLPQSASGSKGLSERDARWFFHQLIFALDFSHKVRTKIPPCNVDASGRIAVQYTFLAV